MGPIGQLLQMVPGAGQMAGAAQEAVDSGQMKRIEAIIDSMTPEERRRPDIIKASRRRRIALGSGTSTAEVNRLLKQFVEMQKMMKMLSGGKMPRLGGGLGALLGSLNRCIASSSPSSRCIGLTAAAFVAGYLLLFSASTDRAAALAPANSAFYVNVYLQPSTGQQMNLAGLIGRLPGFADEASLDEKVDQVVQNLLGEHRDRLPRADQAVARQPDRGRRLARSRWRRPSPRRSSSPR